MLTFLRPICSNFIVHEVPRFIRISGYVIRDPLVGGNMIHYEQTNWCRCFSVSFAQLDFEAESECPYLSWRHPIEPEFSVRIFLSYACYSYSVTLFVFIPLIYCFFISDSGILGLWFHSHTVHTKAVHRRLFEVRHHIQPNGTPMPTKFFSGRFSIPTPNNSSPIFLPTLQLILPVPCPEGWMVVIWDMVTKTMNVLVPVYMKNLANHPNQGTRSGNSLEAPQCIVRMFQQILCWMPDKQKKLGYQAQTNHRWVSTSRPCMSAWSFGVTSPHLHTMHSGRFQRHPIPCSTTSSYMHHRHWPETSSTTAI